MAEDLTWRRYITVVLVCAILSTQVLFQPGILDDWSPQLVARGWFDFFAEVLACGTFMWIAVTLVEHTVKGQRAKFVAFLAALAGGSFTGFALATLFLQPEGFYPPVSAIAGDSLRWAVFGGIVLVAHRQLKEATRAAAALEEESLHGIHLDRQMIEAQLQVLQAQIEPHFLFNTLAHVKRLYSREPQVGIEMLSSLRLYLRAALPRMRAMGSTVEREAELARAYLSILRIRLGDRLQFSVEIAEHVRSHSLPPMILLTLVENAIKHGIAPHPEGGDVSIRASGGDGRLEVEVADTGAGFTGSSGSGVGLSNTRARLEALFGGKASLSLMPNSPRGVIARIQLPAEAA